MFRIRVLKRKSGVQHQFRTDASAAHECGALLARQTGDFVAVEERRPEGWYLLCRMHGVGL